MGLDDSEVQLFAVEVLRERERTPSCSPHALTSSPRMLKVLELLPCDCSTSLITATKYSFFSKTVGTDL